MTAPVEAIVPALIAPTPVEAGREVSRTADFGNWLTQQLNQVNDRLIEADQQVRKLAVGEADNLHQVMISLEKAKLSFELLVQVRNRMLEAYQDVMRMQL